MDAQIKRQVITWAKNGAMTIAGLTMAATPLALWASPTLSAFYAVLITCAVASGLVLLLSQLGPDDAHSAKWREERIAMSPRLVHHLQNQRELGRKDLPELRRFVRDNTDGPADKKTV